MLTCGDDTYGQLGGMQLGSAIEAARATATASSSASAARALSPAGEYSGFVGGDRTRKHGGGGGGGAQGGGEDEAAARHAEPRVVPLPHRATDVACGAWHTVVLLRTIAEAEEKPPAAAAPSASAAAPLPSASPRGSGQYLELHDDELLLADELLLPPRGPSGSPADDDDDDDDADDDGLEPLGLLGVVSPERPG